MKSPKNIPAEIAQRGYDYFQQNKVKNIIKIKENHFSASIQGSEIYDCEIQLDKHGNWQGGECDCPYDWDDVCKHQAALWYAVQAQDFSQSPSEMDMLNAQLVPLSAEKLRALLCQLAAQHAGSHKALQRLLHLSQPNTSGSLKQKAKAFFAQEKDEYYGGRYWTVDVDDCDAWLADLEQDNPEMLLRGILALWQKADDCITQNEYVADEYYDFFDVLTLYLDKLPIAELSKEVLAQWGKHLDKVLDDVYYIDFLEDFYSECYTYRARIWEHENDDAAWLAFLDRKMQQYQSSKNYVDQSHYQTYALEKWRLLQKHNAPEAHDFFNQHLDLHAFREIALKDVLAKGDFALAETLILQGIELAKQNRTYGIVHQYQRQLIDVYEKQGKAQAKSQLLYELIFEHQNLDFIQAYREWKATIAAENWERECNKIAPQIKKLSQHNYLLFLREECRQPELLEILKKSNQLSELMEFAPSLAENQVMMLLPQFMALLRRQIHCATSREMYRYWAQTVGQTAEQFPVFKAHLQELVRTIKAEFPRKPALQEELGKVKF